MKSIKELRACLRVALKAHEKARDDFNADRIDEKAFMCLAEKIEMERNFKAAIERTYAETEKAVH